MAKQAVTPVAHPWKKTARTIFQAFVGLCAAAPLIWQAATASEPGAAAGAAGVGLAVAAAVTRVMALPAVEELLRRFVPWLAACDVEAEDVVAVRAPDGQPVAGPAHPARNGTPLRMPVARRRY